jgi:asparagine synthase (glutamine-hydrolysing)
VAVDGDGLDESAFAAEVARHLGTEHCEVRVGEGDIPGLVEAVGRSLDEPVSDPAAGPTYALARLARRDVTVVLTGEGADETWCGYDGFRKGQLVSRYRRVPGWIRRALTDPVLRRVPHAAGARLVDASRDPRYVARLSHFDPPVRRALYTAGAATAMAAGERADEHASLALDAADPFYSISRDLIDSHLAERLLVKVDRTTMAHSLEARVPYLDHHLIDFALSVSPNLKLRGRTSKYLLRAAFRRDLPERIWQRRKHAFDLPCGRWLRTTLAPLVDGLVHEPAMGDVLDAKHVQWLWQQHRSGSGEHAAQVWALMTLELWARAFRGSP